MSECLEDAGWSVTISGGGIDVAVPEEQADAFEADADACTKKFGYDQPPAPLSASEAGEQVDVLEAGAQCLIDHGYSVPEQPSRAESIDGLMAEWDPRWDIYGDIPEGSAMAEAQDLCPAW